MEKTIKEYLQDVRKDAKKYGKIDEEGNLIIDSGIQSQVIGKLRYSLFESFGKSTNFLEMAKKFIKIQPIYYDKLKIWWLWNHKNMKWEMIDEVDLLNAVDNYTMYPSTNLQIKAEIIEALKRVGRKNKPLDSKGTWIQFKDTIYDIETGDVFKASPKYFITNPIPWSVGDSEETPTMDRIFKEWVNEPYVKTLYEIMAYCLIPSMPIHRMFCFIGDGLNGKGTFLRLIEMLVGNENKCASEIESLSSNRFETFKLYRKLVCIIGEIDKGVFKKTKTVKSLTGDDLIRFEKKGKDGFDGHNYAKPLIATNHLPETTDKAKGFYRRWTIVDFPNEFSEKKNILAEIPEIEFNNFCRKSINILKELLEKGEFENDGSIKDREDNYEKHSNRINEFIKMYCEKGDDFFIEFSDFYEKYNDFLASEGFHRKSKIEVGRAIKLKGFEKKVKKIGSGIIQTTKMCIIGIKIKEDCMV